MGVNLVLKIVKRWLKKVQTVSIFGQMCGVSTVIDAHERLFLQVKMFTLALSHEGQDELSPLHYVLNEVE